MTVEMSWTVRVSLSQRDGQTWASASLPVDNHAASHAPALQGRGHAWLPPGKRDVPQIGREVAAARALADLAQKLIDTATDHIDASADRP